MLLAFGLAAWLLTFSCAILILPLGVLYLRGVGKLKTAKGYEEWLKRAEEIASKRKRQGRNFECQYEWVDSEEILR
jgi:hypothetical protein